MNEVRSPSLVWFRQDLRLADNPALQAAVRREGPIVAVYIWSPEDEGGWAPGAAARWWLHQSLTQLDASLRVHGARLILRRGPALQALRDLAVETGATALFWNRRYEPASIARDTIVKAELQQGGLQVESCNGTLLFEPWTVRSQQDKPYQVFAPFWKTCLSQPDLTPPLAAPAHLVVPDKWPASLGLHELELEPRTEWAGGLREMWRPGEEGGASQLSRFVDGALAEYPTGRNRPDIIGSSRLSPYLHFGEVSARQAWFAIHNPPLANTLNAPMESVRAFARELGWREFAYHLLYHFPDTPELPLREKFARFPWRSDPEGLRAWQRGRTGYPIVDAGMRELWHTGWMHNRVRMIVSSFLVKDLLIPWQEGAAWFWDTLVDADLANNTSGWQWSAGCGADAAPFFRIFNPVLQGETFDPEGAYVRRWVPELKDVPTKWIHQPWNAPPDIFTALGDSYPAPIVDHAYARARALEALRQVSGVDPAGVAAAPRRRKK